MENNLLEENKETAGTLVAERAGSAGIGDLGGVGNVGAQAEAGTQAAGTQAAQQAQAGTGTGTGDTRQDDGNGNAGTVFERQSAWMDKRNEYFNKGFRHDEISKIIGEQPIKEEDWAKLSDEDVEALQGKWLEAARKFIKDGFGRDAIINRIGYSPRANRLAALQEPAILSAATAGYQNWRRLLITGDNYRRFKESGENDAEKEKLYENAYIAKGLEAMGMQVSAPERVDEMFGKDGVLGVEKRDFLTFLGEFEKFDGKLKVAADFYGSSPDAQERMLRIHGMTREEFRNEFVPKQVDELMWLLPGVKDEDEAKKLVQMCVLAGQANAAPVIRDAHHPDMNVKYREYYREQMRNIFMGLDSGQQARAARIIRNVCKEPYSGFWESLFGKLADEVEAVVGGTVKVGRIIGHKISGTPDEEFQREAMREQLYDSMFSREYEKNWKVFLAGGTATALTSLATVYGGGAIGAGLKIGAKAGQAVSLSAIYGLPTIGNSTYDYVAEGLPVNRAIFAGIMKGAGEVMSEYIGNGIIYAKTLMKTQPQITTQIVSDLLKNQQGWREIAKGTAKGALAETGEELANAIWGTVVDWGIGAENPTADLEAFKDNFGEIVLSSLLMMGGGHAIVKARAVKDYIDNGSSFKEALMTPATPWGAMKAANKAEADANKIGVAMGMLKSKLVADQENGHIQMVKIAGDAVNQIDLTEWAKLGIAEREQVIRERFFGGEKFGKSDIVNAGEILDFVAARTKEAETQAKSAIDEAKPMTGDEMQAAQAAVERATGKQAGTETAGTETAGTGAVQQAQTAGTGDNETGDARQDSGNGLSYDDFVFAVKRDSSFLDVNRYAPGLSIAADVSAALGNGISGADKGRVAILKDVFGREDWKPFKKLAFVRHYNRLAAGTANPVSAGTGAVYNKTELLNRALREFSDGFGEGIKMPEGETLPEEVLPASDVDLVDDGWKDVFFDNGTREALSILRNLGVDISPNDMIGFFGGNVLAGTDFEARKAFVSEVAQGMASHAVSASAEGKRISRRSMTEAVNERLAKRYGNVADYVERRAETMKLIESDSVKVMADSFLRRQGLSDVLKDLKLRVVGEINDETWGEFEKQLREAGCQATREDLEGRAWNGFSFGNTIFINEKVAAKEGFTKTLGHEIWHFLKSNVDEGEWKALRDRLLSGEVFNGYLWHFENVLNARDGLGTVLNLDGLLQQKRSLYSDVMTKSGVGAEAVEDYLKEEVSADVVGWLLFSHEPRLVAKAAKKPGFKERIKEWLRLFVGSVRGLRVENEAKRALAGFESLLAGERAGTGDNETGDTRRTGTRDDGNEFEVLTPNKGRRVKVKGEYRVVDSSDINFVDITQTGAQNEQQRDRNTGRTSAQSDEILANFYPEMLLDNKSTGSGAPLVREIEGGKLLSVSGHGRSLTLRELHSRGKNPEDVKARANLDNYLNAVRAFCREHGIEFDEKIANPVLVRVGLEADNGNDWAEVSQLSNEDDKIRQTRGEQAQNDSLKITDELLAKIPVGVEAKNIADTEYNLEFISAFNDLVKAGQDYKNDAANNFNELMAERALDAIFAYLINDRGVVRDVLDRYTMTFREQVSDIQDLAVRILLMNERGNGNREFYVGNEVRHAFAAAAYAKKTNNRAREQGTKVRNIEGLIASYFQDLGFKDKRIGSGEIDCDVNIAEALAVMMMKNGGKRHECKNVLANYLSIVETERGVSGNEFDMFAPAKTKREYFDAALAAFAESKKKKRSGDDDGVFSLERAFGEAKKPRFSIERLYQGGRGVFTILDDEYLGTGEGSHYYGFGHYLSTQRNVAEYYAKKSDKAGLLDEWSESEEDFNRRRVLGWLVSGRFKDFLLERYLGEYLCDFEPSEAALFEIVDKFAEFVRNEDAINKESVRPVVVDALSKDEEFKNNAGEDFGVVVDYFTKLLLDDALIAEMSLDFEADYRNITTFDVEIKKPFVLEKTIFTDEESDIVSRYLNEKGFTGDGTPRHFNRIRSVSGLIQLLQVCQNEEIRKRDLSVLTEALKCAGFDAIKYERYDANGKNPHYNYVLFDGGAAQFLDREFLVKYSLAREGKLWTPEFDFGGDDGDGAGGAGSTKIGGLGDVGGVGAQAGAERGTGTGTQAQAGTGIGDNETGDARQAGTGTGTVKIVDSGGTELEVPLNSPLKVLGEGEVSLVERRFRETKRFEFFGGNKVESVQDVAFIMRGLKDSAVEHSFLVMVKDGVPVVLHTGMGMRNETNLDFRALRTAIVRYNPDTIYSIHNHPSGNLSPSPADYRSALGLLKLVERVQGKLINVVSMIIDSYKNEFTVYSSRNRRGKTKIHKENFEDKKEEKRHKVYEFSKLAFSKDFKPNAKIFGANDIAAFLASHRLGVRNSISFLVVDKDRTCLGSYCLPETNFRDIRNGYMDGSGSFHKILDKSVWIKGGRVVFYSTTDDFNEYEIRDLRRALWDKYVDCDFYLFSKDMRHCERYSLARGNGNDGGLTPELGLGWDDFSLTPDGGAGTGSAGTGAQTKGFDFGVEGLDGLGVGGAGTKAQQAQAGIGDKETRDTRQEGSGNAGTGDKETRDTRQEGNAGTGTPDGGNGFERVKVDGSTFEISRGMPLRLLNPGEKCYAERQFTKNGEFDLTGGEKIESVQDVAFLFKSLKSEAVVHSFFVCVDKNGKAVAVHAGMSADSRGVFDVDTALNSVLELNPERVYFVRNHPDGDLTPDKMEVGFFREIRDGIKRISDKKIPITAIILDTYKNQFFTFDGNGIKNTEYENFSGKIDEKNYDVHEFNKSVFTDEFYKIKSCSDGLDVAEFIASQRLGKRGCLNFLTMTGDRKVSGAYCLPQASVEEVLNDKELLGRILNRAYRSSALFVVFYGDIPGEKEKIASCFGKFNIYCTFWDSPAGEKYSLSRGGNGNDGNGNGALSAGAGVFDEIIRRRNEKYSDIGNVRLLKVLGAAAAQVILNDGSTVVGDVVAADVCRGNEWMIDDVKTFGGFVAGVVREALKDSGRKASFEDVVKAVDLVSRMRAMKRLDDAVSPFDGNAIDSMKKSVKTRAGAGRNVRAVSVGAKNVDALNLGSRIFTVGLQRDAGTEEQNVRNSMDAERERRRADEDTRNNKKDRKLPESSGKPQRAVETDGWKGFEDVGNLKGNDSFEAMTDDLVRLCADAVFGKGKVEDVRAVEAFLERPEVSVEQAERFVKTLRGTAAAEITKIMQRSVAKHSQRPVYGCIQAIVQENNVSIIMQAIDRAFSTIARNKVSESRAEVYERLAKLVKTGGAFKSKELDENRKLGGRTELFLKYCRDVFFDNGNTMISTIDKIRKLESRIIELSERMDLDAAELNELDNGRMMMTALRLLGGAKTKSAVELEDVYFELERAIEVAADAHETDVEKERERRERERAPLIAAMRAGTRLGENQDSIVRDVVNLARGTTSVKQQLESFAKFADGNERKEALAAAKLFSDKISDASSIRDGLSFERANVLQERMEALFGGTEAMEAFMRDFNKESAEIGNEFSVNKTPMSKARLAFVYAQVRQEHYGKPLTLPDEEIAGLSDDVRAKLDLIQKRIKQIPRMEEVLGEQGVAVVDTLCEMLDERKGALQEAFKEMTGYAFDMNEVYNGKAAYFPIFRTGRGEALRSGGISVDAVPVRLNGRVMSFQDISEEYNIFTVFDSVSGGNEHFIAYRNVVRDYQALFADDDFVDAAKYHIGKDIYQQFREHVQQVLTNKKRADKNVFDRTIDKITSATSMVCLGGNALVTLRQTTSIPAFLFNMEGKDFLKALYSAGTKEGWETMKMLYKECPWMIQRRNRGFDAARAKAFREESWLKQKSAKLGAWYMFNNQLGDMVPILIVGQGIYRAAYAGALKHMGVDESTASEEQKAAAKQKAFSVFAAAADMSQQAGRIENSGASQRSGGSFGRAINQFKSTSQQFLSYDFRASEDFVNLVWRGLKKWRSGEKTFEDFVKETAADDRTKELGKVLFVNHVLLPGFYCLMTMLFDLMIGGDPDDWTEDWFKNFALPMILGPMSGLYFLGFGLANVWNRKHVGTSVPGIETLQKAHYFVDAVKDCFDDEKETDDVINDLDNGMRSLFPFYRHMSQAYENYTEDDY